MNKQQNERLEKWKPTKINYDWVLLGVVSLLCIFGLAFLASSLSTLDQAQYRGEFIKQLVLGVGIGSILAFVFARIDYHVILKNKNLIILISFISLAFLGSFAIYTDLQNFNERQKTNFIRGITLPIKPHVANGAIRWIDFPVFPNFQPSELAKIAVLVYFSSSLLSLDGKKITWLSLKKPFYVFAVIAFLILIQPDLGTILLMFGIIAAAMWVSKVPMKILAIISLAVIGLGLVQIILVPYRFKRFVEWQNPTPQTALQVKNVRNAIENGGLWGKGYGNSEFKQQRMIYEQSTDAIIAIIGEEMGFVLTILFLSLYLMLAWRGIKIAEEAPDVGGKALAAGLTVSIVSQAFLNVVGITGITPLKGVPLPFVSQGGSSIVINLMAIGILLSISNSRLQKDPVTGIPKKPFLKFY